jgi:hypothetical protein
VAQLLVSRVGDELRRSMRGNKDQQDEAVSSLPVVRKAFAIALLLVGFAHIFIPSKVMVDWATIGLLGGAAVLLFAHELKGILPFIESVEIGKAKITLRQESKKLAQMVRELENSEIFEAEKPRADYFDASMPLADLVREQRWTDTSRESKILRIAAVDKFTAILQIGMELEAEMLLLAAMIGLRNRARVGTFPEAVEALSKQGLIAPDTRAALLDFWRLRNNIAHAQYPIEENDPVLTSFLDSGLRLLRLITNIPRPIYRVSQPAVQLYKDESCTQKIDSFVGVLLEVTEPNGSKSQRVFPAGRKFKEGEVVGWDWDDTKKCGSAYFVDPKTQQPTLAWSESFAFSGRNEDLRFNALRDKVRTRIEF